MRRFLVCAAVVWMGSFLASSSLFGTVIDYGTLDTFTSTTDPNLDLNPATKVYAIDVGSTSDVTVNNGIYSLTFKAEWPSGTSLDAASTADTFTSVAAPTISGTGATALQDVLRSAYPHDVGNSCTIDLAVNQHQTYDLQLLLSENYWDDSERGGNIALDNTLLVENLAYNGNAGPPFVYHYTFTASSSMVQLKMIGISGFNSTPELEALTLSTIPEPSTAALLVVGLLSLLAYAWRKRR